MLIRPYGIPNKDAYYTMLCPEVDRMDQRVELWMLQRDICMKCSLESKNGPGY